MQNQVWPLDQIIGPSSTQDVVPLALALAACIVLNAPVISLDIFKYILSSSSLRICADGGSNKLYSSLFEEGFDSKFLPSAIVGDLDSIQEHVFQYFSERGVEISQIIDQDRTDLEKALEYAETNLGTSEPSMVVILGSIGSHEGRIDQFFAAINAMYRFKDSASMRLVQVGNQSAMILLNEGMHEVIVPASAVNNHCGLIPIFGKVDRLVTSGLEWDFSAALGPSFFGGIVSTNNIIRASRVVIETSQPILFTMTYR